MRKANFFRAYGENIHRGLRLTLLPVVSLCASLMACGDSAIADDTVEVTTSAMRGSDVESASAEIERRTADFTQELDGNPGTSAVMLGALRLSRAARQPIDRNGKILWPTVLRFTGLEDHDYTAEGRRIDGLQIAIKQDSLEYSKIDHTSQEKVLALMAGLDEPNFSNPSIARKIRPSLTYLHRSRPQAFVKVADDLGRLLNNFIALARPVLLAGSNQPPRDEQAAIEASRVREDAFRIYELVHTSRSSLWDGDEAAMPVDFLEDLETALLEVVLVSHSVRYYGAPHLAQAPSSCTIL